MVFLRALYFGSAAFSLYINDLPSIVKQSNIHLYTDDTSVHYSSHLVSELEMSLQKDMDVINLWMCANKIKLNSSKSVATLLGTR